VKKVGSTLGKGYGPINPFNLGYDLGHDVIAPAIMKGSGVGLKDRGLGGARISFHDGTPLWKFAARRQSGGSFAPLGYYPNYSNLRHMGQMRQYFDLPMGKL
jgi:hypothetical protein